MKRSALVKTLLIVDIIIFCITRFVGLAYGKIGPSGIVNGIVLYCLFVKKKRWAYICFGIFTCLGLLVAGVSILGNILLPWESTAPFFGYASIVCGIAYVFTMVVAKKIKDQGYLD